MIGPVIWTQLEISNRHDVVSSFSTPVREMQLLILLKLRLWAQKGRIAHQPHADWKGLEMSL